MLFVRGEFLGIKSRELPNKRTGAFMTFHEAGVGVDFNDGFGGTKREIVYLRVPQSLQNDAAALAKFNAAKGKKCNIHFYQTSRKGNNGQTYYDRYLQGEPELVKG